MIRATLSNALSPLAQFDAPSWTGPEAETALPASAGHYTWVVWLVCALVILLLQVILIVWVARDAGESGKSRGFWLPVCSIPFVGLLCVLIYLLSSQGASVRITELEAEAQRREDELTRQGQEIARLKAGLDELGQMGGFVNEPGPVEKGTRPINLKPQRLLQLTVVGGPRHGTVESLPLRDYQNRVLTHVIGTDAECRINLPEREYDTVSRQHCKLKLREDDNAIVVADLASTNGTKISRHNGEDVIEVSGFTPLQNGDNLFLGNVQLQVAIIEPDSVAVNPPAASLRPPAPSAGSQTSAGAKNA